MGAENVSMSGTATAKVNHTNRDRYWRDHVGARFAAPFFVAFVIVPSVGHR